MILAYDGTTSLASLVSSTSLKIKMVLKDCSRAYSSEYVTSVNIVVPEPPTFATDMPATFTAVSGSDKTWTLPSINQGDLGFDDPIVISTSDVKMGRVRVLAILLAHGSHLTFMIHSHMVLKE